MASFILRGEFWIRKQFQASLLMIHISQDSVSCIVDGKHDNDILSETVVVLFIKYYCKSYMSQSLRVAVSDSGRVDGPYDTQAAPLAFLCPRHVPDKSPEGRMPTFQSLANPASLLLSVRRWYNAKTQVKL